MKIEKLEDLLEIDINKLKSQESRRVLTKLNQLIKGGKKSVVKADEIAEDFPYEAVSIVGNKVVTIKFDLVTKRARVVDESTDTRDIKGRNYMAANTAITRLEELVRVQKEKK